MKSVIVFILSLFFIGAASSQSFNKIPGKQDFTDSIKFSKFLNSVGEDSVLTVDRVTKKLKFVLKGGGSGGGVDSCTSASNGFYYWKSGTPTLVVTPNNVYSFILNYDSTYQLIYRNSVLEDSISLGVKSLYPEIGSSITIRGNGDSVFIGDGGSGVGYVPYTGATSSPNLGEFGISEGFSQYDTTVTTYTRNTGNIGWNDTDGTLEFNLKGNSVSLQIGQETVLRVVNKTGLNLLESQYLAVYVSGAQGQRVKVNLASANADSMSAKTIGVVTENINVNQEGFITTSGLVREINTTGSLQSETWADGDILYLSPTINGGLTNIKPTAPQHTVLMGYCVYAHAVHGSIFVKVVDGFKLDDLHNVNITTPLNNEALVYETATKLWKNKAPIDATKLNISDTASMLSGYQTAINNKQPLISVLPIANGGTNLSSYSTGDLPYSSAANVLGKLGIGSNGQVLTVVSGLPAWASGGAVSAWSLGGNTLLSRVSNYIGTSDTSWLVIRTKNINRVEIDSLGGINLKNSYIGFFDAFSPANPTNLFQPNTINLYGSNYKIGVDLTNSIYMKNGSSGGFSWYINTTRANARINANGNFEQASGFWSFGDNIATLADPTNATQNHTYEYFYSGSNVFKTGMSAARNGKYDIYHQTGSVSGGGYRWYNGTTELMTIDYQGRLGIGNTSPATSSLVDIASTTKGVLLPRLTTTQVNAIASPATGLTVYNTTENTLCFYNGTTWQKVTSTNL